MKYEKALIFKYVTGNDILNYDISYLENDINFMKEVFNYTNNEDYYDLCSDNLKSNYNFTMFLINKFRNNYDFVEKVALNYQKYMNNNINNIELYITMYDIYLNSNRKEEFKYKLYLDNIYLLNINKINILKDIYKDNEEILLILKNKFSFIEEEYKDSNIIKKYFAKKMLNDILNIDSINTKNILSNFKIDKDIDKSLIKYISLFDQSLATYLLNNISLLKSYRYLVNKNNLVDINSNLILLNKIDIYLDVYKDEIKMSRDKILYYFAYKLNLTNLLLENELISKDVLDKYKNLNINNFLYSDKIIYLRDYYHIENIKNNILDRRKYFVKSNQK